MRPATPIVMVSGFGDIMNATGEMPRGVDALLGKPVTRTELSGAIAKAMGCVAAS
jgi:FixJ family two-component response regulator